MSKDILLKYANSSQQNNKKCFALRDWCHRQGDIFGLQEVFDCLYEFSDGDIEQLGKNIDQLTHKSKVYGRSSVVWGDGGSQMYLTRGEDGKLMVKGYDNNFTPNEKGQHLTHAQSLLRNDGQIKKNVIQSREKLFDLGKEVRSIYTGQSNAFITLAMIAIKRYAKDHKKSEMSIVDKLKSGKYRFNASNGTIVSNSRTVKLNETQLKEMAEATKLTEYKFYNNVQRFLSDLLRDPVGAKVPFLLQANNIARNYLLYHLKSQGIINRHQKISDKDSQGNPKTAKMIIRYSVPKKDFAKKMKKLFIAMVAKNVPEKTEKVLTECDGGGVMGGDAAGTTSADSSGQFSQPLFGVQRRKMPNEIDETTATTNVGNYQYTVPFGSDEETRDRKPGFSVERQNEGYSNKKKLLNEDRESKNMSKARRLITQRNPNSDAQKTIEAIRNDIPNSRLMKCEFLPGVTRMFLDGKLNDASIIRQLNQTLKYVATDAHAGEYSQDLNGEDPETLINRFKGNVQQDIDNDRQSVGNVQYQQNDNYNIVKIQSFEQAQEYGNYTSWCVTHYPNMYESYTAGGENVFYFCLKNGFENVPAEEGENCPKDEYGLSMIAISVCPDGSLNTSTCRWNHDNGGDDNIFTTKEISQIIGRNFYQTFLPQSPEEVKKIRQAKIDDLLYEITEYGNSKEIDDSGRYLTVDDYDPTYEDSYIIYDSQTEKVISGDYIFTSVGDIIEYLPHLAFIVSYGETNGVFFPEFGFVPCKYSEYVIRKVLRQICECLPCEKDGRFNYFDVNELTYLYNDFSDKIPSINTLLGNLNRKISKDDILNFKNIMGELYKLNEKGIATDTCGIAYEFGKRGYELFDVASEVYPKPIYVGDVKWIFYGTANRKDMMDIIDRNSGKHILYSLRTHQFVMNGFEFNYVKHYQNDEYVSAHTDNGRDFPLSWYEIDLYGKPFVKGYHDGHSPHREKIS